MVYLDNYNLGIYGDILLMNSFFQKLWQISSLFTLRLHNIISERVMRLTKEQARITQMALRQSGASYSKNGEKLLILEQIYKCSFFGPPCTNKTRVNIQFLLGMWFLNSSNCQKLDKFGNFGGSKIQNRQY